MNNSHLAFCPYCNKKLRYFESWSIHRHGEYTCPKCGYNSKISYTRNLKTFLLFTIILAVFLAVLFTILGNVKLIEVVLVSMPFLIFYILVPFFMILKTTQQKSFLKNIFEDNKKQDLDLLEDSVSSEHTNILPSSKIKSHNQQDFQDFNNLEQTRIIDSIR